MTHTDRIPDTSNRFAFLVGRVFHPYLVAVIALLAVLSNLTLVEALGWSALVFAMVLLPGILTVAYLRRQDKRIYQRKTRGPVYIVVLVSILICLVVLTLWDAPEVLVACIATLAVWLPLQLLINTFVTKISTHIAVLAGCLTALWYLDIINTPLLIAAALVALVLTMWSRMTTKDHTLAQVVLGLLVGAGSVLAAFPLLLG